MNQSTRLLATGVAAAILVIMMPAVSWGKTKANAAPTGGAPAQVLQVDFWHLSQSGATELYQELCSYCHGVEGGGNGPAAATLAVAPPALNGLKQAGIPQQHWTYALGSACEDRHHRPLGADEGMPCWQQIFRQALGNDAAPILVRKRLVDHLASIQR